MKGFDGSCCSSGCMSKHAHCRRLYMCMYTYSNLQMYEYKYNVVVYVIPAYSCMFISRNKINVGDNDGGDGDYTTMIVVMHGDGDNTVYFTRVNLYIMYYYYYYYYYT